MQPLPMGLLVCGGILLLAYHCKGPLIVSLLVSLAFGSTAALVLSSLGGSTPLIYTAFGSLLVVAVAFRRTILEDLGRVFGRVPDAWVLSFLLVYAVIGAILLPRLFAGQTTAFTKPPGTLYIVETSLMPVAGNITQTSYFVLNGLIGVALCALLLGSPRWQQVRSGFILFSALTAGLGVLDLAGKLMGAGDLLEPIRTAEYALLTEAAQSGFYRITGAFPESSGFAMTALACLAFAYTYWRRTGERLMLVLWILLLGLLVLSTSSTAYVGLAALSLVALAMVGRSVLSARIHRRELLIISSLGIGVAVALAIALRREGFFDPFIALVDYMVFEKSTSESGRERSYWNTKSIQTFYDTFGLGIGLGSSRASSWPVAVLSQLGVVGSLLIAKLTMALFGSLGRVRAADPELEVLVASVRASALASLFAASLISGTPDPGTIFFIAFAVIAAAKASTSPVLRRSPQSGAGSFLTSGGAPHGSRADLLRSR